MADAITIKALQDASLDAKSLEEVVNGNDTKQVTTRLGENYPSVKKAIKTLFENGGLPAAPFKTKALMTASSLADGKYAQVTDDTVNNGLYVKTTGAWVKSGYDPVKDAENQTLALRDLIPNSELSIPGLINKTKGIAEGNIGFNRSDYIPILPSTTYTVLAKGTGNAGAAWYDKDKIFISGFSPYTLTEVVSPYNAYYLRLSALEAEAGKATLNSNRHTDILDLSEVVYSHIPLRTKELDNKIKAVNKIDPTRYQDKITSWEEVKSFNPRMIGEGAYPIGRRVYDQSLRREIIADGVSWRLPDGSPAISAKNRVYVYPDWFETKKALPNYAKKYHKLFSADNTVFSKVTNLGVSSVSYSDFYGENRLVLSGTNGGGPVVTIPIDGAKLYSFLCFDFYGYSDALRGLDIRFYNSSEVLVGAVSVMAPHAAINNNDSKPYEFGYDYIKQLIPLKDVPNKSTITHMSLQLVTHGGKTSNLYISDIDSVSFKPKITLRFDDALKSAYTEAFPILAASGLRGISAVITKKIRDADPNYSSVADLKEMILGGWDLVSHTDSHLLVNDFQDDPERLLAEYKGSQDYLRDVLGVGAIASSCIISPRADMNPVAMAIQRQFYDCQINQVFINSPMVDQPGGSADGSSGNWMRLGAFNGDNVQTVSRFIDMAEQTIETEGWGIVMLHDVVETSGTYSISKTILREFCEWLAVNSDRIDVVTVSDVVKQVRPAAV